MYSAPRPSRRAFLLGGLSVAVAGGAVTSYELVRHGVLPGKYALARLTGACGSAPPPPRGLLPIRREIAFHSAYRHRDVTMVMLIPAGLSSVRGLGVVVCLHGASADARSMADQIGPAMTAAGVRRFAAVTVDGGNTYWHQRIDGDDPVGMIIHEVLPRLADAGARTERTGITGESMGGYGALLIAEQLAASSVGGTSSNPKAAAVAALSPAIFTSFAAARAANGDAFDSQADFDRNNALANVTALRSVPAWVSCGTDDPFEPATALIRARLAGLTGHQVAGGILSGCHDAAFWERNLPAALAFVEAHLG